MSQYIRAGGYVMWALMALSAVMIYIAVRFLLKPNPARLAVLRALSWAHVLMTLGGIATNLTTVCKTVVHEAGDSGAVQPLIVIQGIGESLTPAGFGFSILAFVWLIIALAVRRAHEPPA
jgi:hypothetical protein